METLEEMHQHYKAVRNRIRYAPFKKPVVIAFVPQPEPEFEPEPETQSQPKEIKYAIEIALPLSPAQCILQEVALKHGITIQDIKCHSHKKLFVKARQEAAYLMQRNLKLSLPMIGSVMGKRDHTTILHAIRKYKKLNQIE
jgi:chromosomal replication initiation ATPase DnaA